MANLLCPQQLPEQIVLGITVAQVLAETLGIDRDSEALAVAPTTVLTNGTKISDAVADALKSVG